MSFPLTSDRLAVQVGVALIDGGFDKGKLISANDQVGCRGPRLRTFQSSPTQEVTGVLIGRAPVRSCARQSSFGAQILTGSLYPVPKASPTCY